MQSQYGSIRIICVRNHFSTLEKVHMNSLYPELQNDIMNTYGNMSAQRVTGNRSKGEILNLIMPGRAELRCDETPPEGSTCLSHRDTTLVVSTVITNTTLFELCLPH